MKEVQALETIPVYFFYRSVLIDTFPIAYFSDIRLCRPTAVYLRLVSDWFFIFLPTSAHYMLHILLVNSFILFLLTPEIGIWAQSHAFDCLNLNTITQLLAPNHNYCLPKSRLLLFGLKRS